MGERSQADFARLIGVTDGQLSKWRTMATGVKVETVIAIARKLNDSPLHALVEVGYLRPEDVAEFRVHRAYGLADYDDHELTAEIVRRISAGKATADLTEPIELHSDVDNIRPIRRTPPAEMYNDLEEVASETITFNPEDTDDKYTT